MSERLKFHRARSDDQIRQRREAFLDAARTLLAESGVEGVTLNALANAVNLSKSNLYRYFESCEDVLAEVYHQEARRLSADLISSFKSMPRRNDLSSCAALFSNACGGRPVFCLLHTKMAGSVEQGISLDRLMELKTSYARLSAKVAHALLEAVPALGERGAAIAVRMFMHHLAGCWQYCNPGPNVKAAIAQAGLSQYQQPFRQVMAQSCHTILIGLAAQAHEEDPGP